MKISKEAQVCHANRVLSPLPAPVLYAPCPSQSLRAVLAQPFNDLFNMSFRERREMLALAIFLENTRRRNKSQSGLDPLSRSRQQQQGQGIQLLLEVVCTKAFYRLYIQI